MFNHAVVIDDDPINNFLCEKVLGSSESVKRITTFENPEIAFKYLQENINTSDFPDLVLLDLNMPKLDGWGFLEKFKTLPSHIIENTKLYILTSSVDEGDKRKAQKSENVSGFVQKPLSVDNVKKFGSFNRFNRFMPLLAFGFLLDFFGLIV
ncbi:MAG: response regulator [Cytophagales bacterium]